MTPIHANLKMLADKIRREPWVAQETDVSLMVRELTGHWRTSANMMEVSEEAPVAAWIVRRKAERLVYPGDEEAPAIPFDPDLKPAWLIDAVSHLKDAEREAGRRWGRPIVWRQKRVPAPIKDPSPWKLVWSYPRLLPKPTPHVQTVRPAEFPLRAVMARLLDRLVHQPRLVFQEEFAQRGREEWAATFLAAVHLWHQRQVELCQPGPYGSLVIERQASRDAAASP